MKVLKKTGEGWVQHPPHPGMQVVGQLKVIGVPPITLVAIRKDTLGRRFAEIVWDGDTFKLYPDDSFIPTMTLDVNPPR